MALAKECVLASVFCVLEKWALISAGSSHQLRCLHLHVDRSLYDDADSPSHGEDAFLGGVMFSTEDAPLPPDEGVPYNSALTLDRKPLLGVDV